MAQLNRNSNYIFEVDGITIWERLRVVRSFLSDRNQALKLANINVSRLREKIANPDASVNKWDVAEWEVHLPEQLKLIGDCEREIKFLTELEVVLATEAEKTRVEGKDDEEMYELNYYMESGLRILQNALSEKVAHGYISPNTFKSLVRHPYSRSEAIAKNMITEAAASDFLTLNDGLGDVMQLHASNNQLLVETN